MSQVNMRRLLIRGIKVFSIIIVLHIIAITLYGSIQTKKTADVAIVLGNKVHENGEVSTRLKARLDTALLLYENRQVEKILVSGGLGKEGFLEGDVMAEYLVGKGVARKNIIIDNQGINTKATADNTSTLIKTGSKIIVVSQFFHIPRSVLYMKKAGFDDISSASPYYYEARDMYSVLREIPALYVALLK